MKFLSWTMSKMSATKCLLIPGSPNLVFWCVFPVIVVASELAHWIIHQCYHFSTQWHSIKNVYILDCVKYSQYIIIALTSLIIKLMKYLDKNKIHLMWVIMIWIYTSLTLNVILQFFFFFWLGCCQSKTILIHRRHCDSEKLSNHCTREFLKSKFMVIGIFRKPIQEKKKKIQWLSLK